MAGSIQSGAGSRPVTSGTADNIGAGKAFIPGSSNVGPAPVEGMTARRRDAASVEADDSAPLGLTPSADSVRPDNAGAEGAAQGAAGPTVETKHTPGVA